MLLNGNIQFQTSQKAQEPMNEWEQKKFMDDIRTRFGKTKVLVRNPSPYLESIKIF